MIKKLLLYSLFLTPYTVKAQKHLEQIKGLEVNMAKTGIGNAFNGGYLYFLKDNIYIKGLAYYEYGTPYHMNYRSLGIDVLGLYTLLNVEEIFYCNIGLGPTCNMEKITPSDKKSARLFNYGGKGSLEMETYLTKKIVFTIAASQRLLIKRNIGAQRYELGMGIKYILNTL